MEVVCQNITSPPTVQSKRGAETETETERNMEVVCQNITSQPTI